MSKRKIIAIQEQNKIPEMYHRNKPLIILNYTNSLKEACRHIFSFTEDQLYSNKYDSIDEYWGATPKQIIEYVGNDLLNKQLHSIIPTITENFWVKSLDKKITDNPNVDIIITEIKTKEEIEMLNKHNAEIHKVIDSVFTVRNDPVVGIKDKSLIDQY